MYLKLRTSQILNLNNKKQFNCHRLKIKNHTTLESRIEHFFSKNTRKILFLCF